MVNPFPLNYPPYDTTYSDFLAASQTSEKPPTQSGGTDKLPVVFDVIDISSGAAIGAASAATGGYDPRYAQSYQQSYTQPPYGPWSVPPVKP